MAGSARPPRRGPAPIASFDHDVSDEVRPSSPETKHAFRLPEIVEDTRSLSASAACGADGAGDVGGAGGLGVTGGAGGAGGGRARSQSTPQALAAGAPRIDISRASSSSHQDSRDSSPDLAAAGALGLREDGALDLRASTEELAFLEPAPGERPPPPPPPPPQSRRHSRKDSQGSEAALLAVSGRTSRLSSVGSQGSAPSAGRLSRLSVASAASAASRSLSPHRMLLETSFCGPKPIETDPDVCAAAVEERLLEIAKLRPDPGPPVAVPSVVAPVVSPPVAAPPVVLPPVVVPPVVNPPAVVPPDVVPPVVDARDRREVRTEVTVERPAPRPSSARPAGPTPNPAPPPAAAPAAPAPSLDDDKLQKETRNRVKVEERRARSRERRDSGDGRTKSRSKDIIRIRLKPDSEYDDDDDDDDNDAPECAVAVGAAALKPASLALGGGEAGRKPPRDSRTPSPAGAAVSRKSSFCSLFKSRETIASPDSPSDALRRKKSVTEGRSRSRSRDRSATPTSAAKIKGSVLSLFKTPRKSGSSPAPSPRAASPAVPAPRPPPPAPPAPPAPPDRLKYYEAGADGIVHIPLRTPPDACGPAARPAPAAAGCPPPITTVAPTPGSTSVPPPTSALVVGVRSPSKPIQRTVLPDGSIIIPLRSPTEREATDSPFKSPPSEERVEEHKRVEVSSSARPLSVSSPGPSVSSGRGSSGLPDAAGDGADVTPSPGPVPATAAADSSKRRERLVFMTQVGSGDQVFSTQFSITKTPSVTSEISGSFASFPEPDAAAREPGGTGGGVPSPPHAAGTVGGSSAASPQDPLDAFDNADTGKDSSESEASSETGGGRSGNDVERRGLVVQESFEEELPFVPTTLPQERSLALPMVPVRERAGVTVAPLRRPRATHHTPATPATPPTPPAQMLVPQTAAPARAGDKLRIRLPRRPATAPSHASAPATACVPVTASACVPATACTPVPPPPRERTRSDTMPKPDWIDFEEVPERRKQPKRIQTLPRVGREGREAAVSYVEPEECRCECHARADDETPLLLDDTDADRAISAAAAESPGTPHNSTPQESGRRH